MTVMDPSELTTAIFGNDHFQYRLSVKAEIRYFRFAYCLLAKSNIWKLCRTSFELAVNG